MKREPMTDVVHKTIESLPNKVDKVAFQNSISGAKKDGTMGIPNVTRVGEFPTGPKLHLPNSANKETGYWLS